MAKYDNDVLVAYVNGDDIPGYSVETLEDDVEFMIRVIEYTNDKKMYSFCSDRVKSTYKFVRFLVEKFSNDLDFVRGVGDSYLESTTNEIKTEGADNKVEMLELLIIMYDLDSKTGVKNSKYGLSLGVHYLAEKNSIYMMSLRPEVKMLADMIQLGFIIVYDKYNSSDIIMSYFAKRFIDDIIYDSGINLEDKLHIEFCSYKELEDFGVIDYLLNLLGSYDSFLSKYLARHLGLLDDIIKDIDKMKTRWDVYPSLKEREKYQKVFNEVSNYIAENRIEDYFPETEILYYISMELGVAEVMFQYDDSVEEDYYQRIVNELLPSYQKNINEHASDTKFLQHYSKIRSMMEELLFPEKKKLNSGAVRNGSSENKLGFRRFLSRFNF